MTKAFMKDLLMTGWCNLSISTRHITPYIHAMKCHVGEFLHLHGAILPFTQHGLEKYNDVVMKNFFRLYSCHRGEEALVQIIEKQNQLEYLRECNKEPPKAHAIICLNCSQTGHNRLSCTQPCKFCGHSNYKQHLTTVETTKLPLCNK